MEVRIILKRKIPEIFMECSLIFDNDTDMEQITNEIGIAPSSFKNKRNQRKSPFKDDNLEGYWSIKTKKIITYDFDDVAKEMIEIIKPYLEKMKEMITKYDGTVHFGIVPYFYKNYTPAFYFEKEFLDIVNYLSATIEIDMYVL